MRRRHFLEVLKRIGGAFPMDRAGDSQAEAAAVEIQHRPAAIPTISEVVVL
jgi:hypothetical protein